MPQRGPQKCIWQIFTLSSVKKKNYTWELYKCKCKTFGCVNVYHKCKWLTITQVSHAIHMTIDTYTSVVGFLEPSVWVSSSSFPLMEHVLRPILQLPVPWKQVLPKSMEFKYQIQLVWPVPLAQVLPRPQLTFPSKTWFFGTYFLSFQTQNSLLNQYISHSSESKSYQINFI